MPQIFLRWKLGATQKLRSAYRRADRKQSTGAAGMNRLRIAEDLALPIEVVTEKLAFLGRTGSGKTYAAMKLAELMLEAGAQIVALDPVGAWHGLRIGANFNVYIFGGLRGDFPLEPTGGVLLADV